MRRKKIASIIGIIILIFILVQCSQKDKNESVNENIIVPEIVEPDLEDESDDLIDKSFLELTIKKPIHVTPIYFTTYEDIYIYYSMLEESKGILRDKFIEFFLSVDTQEINQKGFSRYYGNLGRELLKECQRFKLVINVGADNKGLGKHISRYHDLYVNNENYFLLGNDLLDVEKYLNESDYENALVTIKEVFKNIMDMRENENEGKIS